MTPDPPEPNGVVPITQAPPPDVPPTTPGYGTTFGAIERLTTMAQPVPPELASTYDVAYGFKEYYLSTNSNGDVEINLINGQTIDWAASELDQNGSLIAELGIEKPYSLVGKSYSAHQFTFLEFNAVLDENGVDKPVAWLVRMKHS